MASDDSATFSRYLRNFVVLTLKATEVATRRRDRKGGRAGKEVIQRLFLHRIHVLGDNLSIDKAVKRASLVFPNAAYPPMSFLDYTAMVAEKATDPGIIDPFIEHCLFHGNFLSLQEKSMPQIVTLADYASSIQGEHGSCFISCSLSIRA